MHALVFPLTVDVVVDVVEVVWMEFAVVAAILGL